MAQESTSTAVVTYTLANGSITRKMATDNILVCMVIDTSVFGSIISNMEGVHYIMEIIQYFQVAIYTILGDFVDNKK
jgi:hypothetical protein